MTSIITRAQANLPPVSSSVGRRSLSSWAGIRIHHTGGPFSSWRSIHNWQTAGRPPDERLVYIGYSFGIADGRVTELRGFDRHPAHDFINTDIGVVFGGSYGTSLPPAADLAALVWFVGEAERRCGKKLPISTHREVGQTTCPGGRLHRWVKDVLPGRLKPSPDEEDDMPLSKEDVAKVAAATADELLRRRFPRADKQGDIGLASSAEWARHHAGGAKKVLHEEVLPQLIAVAAGITGGDTVDAMREELTRHRAILVAELGDDLADRIAGRLQDVPTDEVRAAVREELSRTRLAVGEPG